MPSPRLVLPALAVAGLITGCGGSSTTDPPTASAPAPAPAATTPAAPVPTTAAGGAIVVDGSEFKFDPGAIIVKAGKLKVTLNNTGTAEHEFVLLKTDQHADALKVTNGRVSEADSVGEVSDTKPGVTKSHTFDLKPGNYVFVCNIPGHYAGGMRGTLTVQ